MAQDYQLTMDDCNAILQQHLNSKNFEILSFEEKSVSKDIIGLMGGHNKLYITVKINNEILLKTFFAKRMRSAYDIQCKMIKVQGAYEKEYFAYRVFKPLFDNEDNYKCDYMPACYFTVKNDLLVFEDLSTDGYVANKHGTMTIDLNELFIGLDVTAKFHAGSIIYETRKSKILGKPYKLSDEYSEYFQEPLYRRDDDYLGNKLFKSFSKAVTALIDLVPQFEGRQQEIKKKYLTQVDRVYELVKESDRFCNVMCHGDLWTCNLLYKYNDDDVPVQSKIIDYQALRYTVPAHDFLYLVAASCNNYDANFDELKQYYYNCLQKYVMDSGIDLNNHMSYQQFLESIDYIFPFVIVQRANFSLLTMTVLDNDVKSDEKMFAKFMYDDMTDTCIKGYQEYEHVREVIDFTFKDLEKL